MVTATKLNKDVGQRVKALRLEQGITQADLAAMLALDETTIRSIEAGRRGMSLETLTRVSKALRAKPSSLLGDDDEAGVLVTEAQQLVQELPAHWQQLAVRFLRDLHGTTTGKTAQKRQRAR
jgi:transcriptional regulator with XRE-family HTH domain